MLRLQKTNQNEIAVVFSNLPDLSRLLNSISLTHQAYVIDIHHNPFTQISEILSGTHDLKAIHFFAHGEVGQVDLGSLKLNEHNLKDYQQELTSIGNSLAEDGELLLYACEVAQGAVGRQFVRALSETMGAHVAASSHKVGHTAFGGHWELDAIPPRSVQMITAEHWKGVMGNWMPFNNPTSFSGTNGWIINYSETFYLQADPFNYSTITLYDNSNNVIGTYVQDLFGPAFINQAVDSVNDGDMFGPAYPDMAGPNYSIGLVLAGSTTLPAGDYYFTITHTGNGGIYQASDDTPVAAVTDPTLMDFTFSSAPAYVTGTTITSSAGVDNTYDTDDAIDITVTFSDIVTVDTIGGTPTLAILVGADYKNATYFSGDNSTELVFRYIVQAGDTDANGISIDLFTDIMMNGGSIKDSNNNNVDTMLVDIADDANHQVSATGGGGGGGDTTAPTVTSVNVPADKTYITGETLTFTVNTDEAVTVDTTGGIPRLALTIGSTTAYANYTATGSTNTALKFTYTVAPGDADADGIAVGALDLSSGTIKDAANNDLNTTLNGVDPTSAVLVDTTGGGGGGGGSTGSWLAYPDPAVVPTSLALLLTYSEAIYLQADASNYSTITVYDGSNNVVGTYVQQTGSSNFVNQSAIDEIDNGDIIELSTPGTGLSLIVTGTTVLPDGNYHYTITHTGTGGIFQVSDDTAVPEVTDATKFNFSIDDMPYVTGTSITSDAGPDNTYVAGDVVQVTVTYHENVVVDTTNGAPTLAIKIGTEYRDAVYATGSGTPNLVFSYTIQAIDTDADGISIDENAVVMMATPETITSTLGTIINPVVIQVLDQATHLVNGAGGGDTTAPIITATNPTNGAVSVAANGNIVITFDENVAAGTGNIVISNGSGDTQTIDVSQVNFSNNTMTINPPVDLIAGGNYYVQIDSTAVVDTANNAFAGIADTTTLNFTVAPPMAAPVLLSTSPADNATNTLPDANITLTFDVDVKPGSGSITILDLAFSTSIDIDVTDSQVTFNGDTVTINPASDLILGREYAVLIPSGAIVGDASNIAWQGINNDPGNTIGALGLTFTLPDAIDPTLSSSSPNDDATNVAADSNIVLTFNEYVAAGTGNIVISNGSSDERTISISDSQVAFDYNAETNITTVTINPTIDLLAGGSYFVQIDSTAVVDFSGNTYAGIADTTTLNFTVATPPDTTPPNITSITFPADGTYGTGETLTFIVNTSENVIVDTTAGIPSLLLDIGGAPAYANYVSGSDSSALVFTYTVEDGKGDQDGIAIQGLHLNDGIMKDAANNNLNTSLSGLSPTSVVLVDTTPPYIMNVDVPSNDTYVAGETLTFTLNANENVIVDTAVGIPRLALTIGSTSVYAEYTATGSTNTALKFTYTVAPGDADADGIAIGALDLNNGTIKDAGNNDLDIAISEFAISGIGIIGGVKVDTAAPGITSVDVPADKTYIEGETLTFTVNTNEAVTVTDVPRLALTIGSTSVYANYTATGSTNTALKFTYTVAPGDADADGIDIGALDLNNGTIKDAANNDLDLTLIDVGLTTGVKLDAAAPGITSVDVPADKTYILGETLTFTINTDEDVSVTGTPLLILLMNTEGTVFATYQASLSSPNQLKFTYTVKAGDADADGIVVDSLALNSGTIKDSAGNNVNLSLTSVDTSGILINGADTTPPIITSVDVPADKTYIVGETLTFTVNTNEAVTVTDVPRLALTIGSTSVYANYTATGSTNTALKFTYTVAPGDADADGIDIGALDLNNGTIKDAANNDLDLTLIDVGPTTAVKVDGVAPEITAATPYSGIEGVRNNIPYTFTSEDSLSFTGSASVTLNIGGQEVTSTSVASIGSKAFTASFNITAGMNDTDGVDIQSITGITDVAGNALDFSSINTSWNLKVDTTAPTITGITPPAAGTYGTDSELIFTVHTSENVFVSGAGQNVIGPILKLNVGGMLLDASYYSGNGTKDIEFKANLNQFLFNSDTYEVTVDSLQLYYDIKDAAGNMLNTSLSGGSTGVYLDFNHPTVQINEPAAGTYGIGDTLTYTLISTENLTVDTTDGTPRLKLDIGGKTAYADYTENGSTATALKFTYTVQAGDTDSDGIVANMVDLNGGSIQGVYNSAYYTFPSTHNVLVDGVAPVIVAAYPSNDIGEGNHFFTFVSTDIASFTSGASMTLNIGGQEVTSTNLTLMASTVFTANFFIAAGMTDSDGIDIVSTTGITDSAGNDVTFDTINDTWNLKVDTTRPTITSVEVPADKTYKAGDKLIFQVHTSEIVNVPIVGGTTKPWIPLTIGDLDSSATYESGSGTNTLTFSATVGAGSFDANGISVGSHLQFASGFITDAAGNALDMTLNNVGSTTEVLVDAVAPTVTSIVLPENKTYLAGEKLTFTVHFSENVNIHIVGMPLALQLSIGGTTDHFAFYESGNGSSVFTFTYTVQPTDIDADSISIVKLDQLSSTPTDTNGNVLNTTLPSIPDMSGIKLNGAIVPNSEVPTLVSSSPADNSFDASADSNIVLTFNEAVKPGTGNITISDGDTAIVIDITSDQVTFDIESKTVTINPTADLSTYTSYYVQIDSAAILDLQDNPYAGIADTTTLNFVVPGPNHAPEFAGLDGVASYTEGGSPVVLDADVTINDIDLADISYQEAYLSLFSTDSAAGQYIFGTTGNLSFNNGNVILSSITIGTYTQADGVLQINFNENAMKSEVDETLQSITYSNTSDAPASSVEITWTFNDGNYSNTQGSGGKLYAFGNSTVNITNTNDDPTGTVSISGTLKEGQTLTAVTSNLADPDGIKPGTYTYQWKAAGVEIEGATGSTYILKNSEIGKTISVDVGYQDNGNTNESVSSASTDVVGSEPFTRTGWTSLDFSNLDNVLQMHLQDNGQFMLVGRYGDSNYFSTNDNSKTVIVKFNANGTLDTSYNGDGKSILDINLSDVKTSLAFDDSLAIIGYKSNGSDRSFNLFNSEPQQPSGNYFITRFDSNGDLDTSYNSTGTVKLDTYYNSGLYGAYELDDGGIQLIRDSDQLIIDFNLTTTNLNASGVASSGFNIASTGLSTASITKDLNGNTLVLDKTVTGFGSNTKIINTLSRYNPNGQLDSSFDSDGKVTTSTSSLEGRVFPQHLTSEDKILIFTDNGRETNILRYNANGTLDNSFGNNGTLVVPISNLSFISNYNNAYVSSDGKIIYADDSSSTLTLYRYNADGSADESFDHDGKAVINIGTWISSVEDVITQADGKIIVTGEMYDPNQQYFSTYRETNTYIVRLNEDGSLDLTFGDQVVGSSLQPGDAASVFEDSTSAVTGNALSNDSGTGTKVVTALNGKQITAETAQSFTGSYGSLTLNADGSYSYQVNNTIKDIQALKAGATVTDIFGYSMKDSSDIAGHGTITITITGVNDAPVANSIEDFTTTAGTAFTYTFGTEAFTDVDQGDTLTYTAQLVDVNGEPVEVEGTLQAGEILQGLSFNAATRTFTGSSSLTSENLFIKVTAIDGSSATASTIFAIEVKTPVVANTKGQFVGVTGDVDEVIAGTTGANAMKGGNGDDTYTVDNKKDGITESKNQGTDTVLAKISYKLGKYLENLTLQGQASENLKGTGNELANIIKGDDGNNVLDGGTGLDTFEGGDGDDIFILDQMAEGMTVTEFEGKGTDEIQLKINTIAKNASTIFTLADNIENLTLTGTAELNLTGNALDNEIIGNIKNNALIGLAGDDTLNGGKGIDTMTGGDGSDVYYVDTGDKLGKTGLVTKAGDSVIESADDTGTDTVISTASYYKLADNVENLILNAAGKGVGNAGDNSITGSAKNDQLLGADGNDIINAGNGNDVLNGGNGSDTLYGGNGNDVLTGGDGIDIFVFNFSPSKTNIDTINDFATGVDKIQLDTSIFTALRNFTLTADNLVQGLNVKTAQDDNDVLIYDTKTGALYYDQDANGTTYKAVQFATLKNLPTLADTDFYLLNI